MNEAGRIYQPPTAKHYALSALVPPLGVVAGIVAMARGMVGPGLALWATSFLGFWVLWPIMLTILGLAL